MPNNETLLSIFDAMGQTYNLEVLAWSQLRKDVEELNLNLYLWKDSRAWVGRIARFSLVTGPDWHTWSPPSGQV